MNSKKVGVIVEVNNQCSKVGVYSLLNDSNIIWKGEVLNGPKIGAYLTINQNDIKIIATVSSEKIIDQQNTVKSNEFDNRFHKNSINRIIELNTKGIIENNSFSVTSSYVPMIGNEVTLTTNEELKIIYGLSAKEDVIVLGKTLIENYPVRLPINNFFASHIGIFGNTGSGKSNTLHKLYLELFKSQYSAKIKEKSKFFVIDFNGEYCSNKIFGFDERDRDIINISTRKSLNKLKVKQNYLFDADVLSILFDARPATQVPFLRKSVRKFADINNGIVFATLEIGLLISILRMIKGPNNIDLVENWINAAKSIGIEQKKLEPLNMMLSNLNYGKQELKAPDDTIILQDAQLTEEGREYLAINEIESQLTDKYDSVPPLIRFLFFLEFQRVYEILFSSTKADYINPLFSRIRPAIDSLNKVVDVIENKEDVSYKTLTIISLVNANTQVTRLIPMLLSKMIYDEHKSDISEKGSNKTIHLIIDEAHNILNSQFKNIGDDWQDYRLSIFEEIIKEGRKFGFYLTLASQRPADISPTIMSQIHNYFIHRLVNEKDLHMLSSTMPTLDSYSFKTIPMLGKGEVIITGTALKIPIMAKIDKEQINRPDSDDIVLTELWK